MEERLRPEAGTPVRVAIAKSNLGQCLFALGRAAEALPLFVDAAAAEPDFGPDHPALPRIWNNYALCLGGLGRGEEALALFERALALSRRLYPGDSPDVALNLHNLALLQNLQGMPLEALPGSRRRWRCTGGSSARITRSSPRTRRAWRSAWTPWTGRPTRLPHHRAAVAALRKALGDDNRRSSPRSGTSRSASVAWTTTRRRWRCSGRRSRSGGGSGRPTATGSPRTWGGSCSARGGPRRRPCSSRRRSPRWRGSAARPGGSRSRSVPPTWASSRSSAPIPGWSAPRSRAGRPAEAFTYLERGRARELLDLLERSEFDPLARALDRARAGGGRGGGRAPGGGRRAGRGRRGGGGPRAPRGGSRRARVDLGPEARAAAVEQAERDLAAARARQDEALAARAQVLRDLVDLADPKSAETIQAILEPARCCSRTRITVEGGLVLVVPPAGEPMMHRWRGGARGGGAPSPPPARGAGRGAEKGVTLDSVARGRGPGPRGVGAGAGRSAGSGPGRGRRARGEKTLRAAGAGTPRRGRAAGGPRRLSKVKRVLVVPHGALHRLPFEVLPSPRGTPGRWWLDDGPPLAYVPSGSVLQWCRARRDGAAPAAREGRARGAGRPGVRPGGRRPGPRRPPRPTTGPGGGRRAGVAGRGVAGRARRAPPRLRASCRSPARGARWPRSPRPSPGRVARPRWCRSSGRGHRGAALPRGAARPVPPPRDPRARGRDRPRLPQRARADLPRGGERRRRRLPHAREPARALARPAEPLRARGALRLRDPGGPLQKDEGVFALPWGFFFAGCPSVIASQWSVGDESTAALMADFYRRLLADGPPTASSRSPRPAAR